MMGHKICFYGEIWLIIPKLSLLPLLVWSSVMSVLPEILHLPVSFNWNASFTRNISEFTC